MSDPLIEGYWYRFNQGPVAHGQQQRPAFLDEVDLGRWAKGWVEADDDARRGDVPRYLDPEMSEGSPPQGGPFEPVSDAGDEPERTTLAVLSPSLPSHWLSATIDRTPEGWVLTIDGQVRAFKDPGKGKAPARLLEVLVSEIAKRIVLDGTREAMAEIHEKTKGAP